MLTQKLIGTMNGGPLESIVWHHKLPEPIDRRPGFWRCESTVTSTQIYNLNVGNSAFQALHSAIMQVSFELAVAVLRGAKLFLPGQVDELTPTLLATCFQFLPGSADELPARPNRKSLLRLIKAIPRANTIRLPLRWLRNDGNIIPLNWTHASPTREGSGWRCIGWVENILICTSCSANSSLLAMISCMRQIHHEILDMINSGERICFLFDDRPLTPDFFNEVFGFSESRRLALITNAK